MKPPLYSPSCFCTVPDLPPHPLLLLLYYYYYRYIYIHIYIYINVETGSLNFLNFFLLKKRKTIDKVFHKITNLVWGYYCLFFFSFPIMFVCSISPRLLHHQKKRTIFLFRSRISFLYLPHLFLI
jgi:hypothetical protein